MCTLTWWAGDTGYEVFFNRDEKKDRPVATPPELSEKEGVRFLAPRDSAAGGTWILVNEFGVTFALLNWYSREVVNNPRENWVSRGQLVRELADIHDLAGFGRGLAGFEPGQFRAFRLLGFFPGEGDSGVEIDFWQWSGQGGLQRMPCPPMPICSSSFDRETGIARRKNQLGEIGGPVTDPDRLWEFHHNSGSFGTSAYSVRMNRPDAQTWSISRVTVERKRIRFLYEAECLDQVAPPDIHESCLERLGS